MRLAIRTLAALWFSTGIAHALTPAQVAVQLPAYQAPGWTAWTPASDSSTKAWWNADDPSAGAVTTWTDSVGSVAPTQGTAANKPTKATDSFVNANGQTFGGVSCDGTNDELTSTSFAALPTGANPVEIDVLADQQRSPADATTEVLFGYGSGSTATSLQIQRRVTSSVNRFSTASGATVIDTTTDFSGVHVVSGIWSATVASVAMDGYLSSAAAATLNTGTTRLRICAGLAASASIWLQVTIRHIIVTSARTDLQRAKYLAWLYWNVAMPYRLPWNNPWRFRKP